MIRNLKHRGLKRLYEHGDRSRLKSNRVNRIEDILARLDVATAPSDLDLPGYVLHALKGDLKGLWSVRVSGNWRIVFRFKDGDVIDVNLIDYH
jgi:proteic killer suppression protein